MYAEIKVADTGKGACASRFFVMRVMLVGLPFLVRTIER